MLAIFLTSGKCLLHLSSKRQTEYIFSFAFNMQILCARYDKPSAYSHTPSLNGKRSYITVLTGVLSMESHIKPRPFKLTIYSRTSNNGHCRGIQILSVIGGVR
jgi:hypothetical protein